MINTYKCLLSKNCLISLNMNKTIRELDDNELENLKDYLMFLTRITRKQLKKQKGL